VYLIFPEYASLKLYAKVLSYKAQRQSDAGDWQGALKTIERMNRISHHAGMEPTLIGMLVQIAIESITMVRFQHIIAANARNAAFLNAAETTLKRFGALPDFRHALNGEMVMTRVTIQSLGTVSIGELTTGSKTSTSGIENAVLNNSGVRRALEAKALEDYNWQFERLPHDPEKWQEAFEVSKQMQAKIDADDSLLNKLNQVIFPVFTQANVAIGRVIAGRHLTGTQIKLCIDRLKTGTYPATLPDYGEVRIDPFTGKPLQYKAAGHGFLLYSFGDDKVDNGGTYKSTGSGTGRDIPIDMR
jgi:hypothetical protein